MGKKKSTKISRKTKSSIPSPGLSSSVATSSSQHRHSYQNTSSVALLQNSDTHLPPHSQLPTVSSSLHASPTQHPYNPVHTDKFSTPSPSHAETHSRPDSFSYRQTFIHPASPQLSSTPVHSPVRPTQVQFRAHRPLPQPNIDDISAIHNSHSSPILTAIPISNIPESPQSSVASSSVLLQNAIPSPSRISVRAARHSIQSTSSEIAPPPKPFLRPSFIIYATLLLTQIILLPISQTLVVELTHPKIQFPVAPEQRYVKTVLLEVFVYLTLITGGYSILSLIYLSTIGYKANPLKPHMPWSSWRTCLLKCRLTLDVLLLLCWAFVGIVIPMIDSPNMHGRILLCSPSESIINTLKSSGANQNQNETSIKMWVESINWKGACDKVTSMLAFTVVVGIVLIVNLGYLLLALRKHRFKTAQYNRRSSGASTGGHHINIETKENEDGKTPKLKRKNNRR
ncbi:hypothetical protein BKA69DRAFT_1043427 [Paraphysoderma sedebokerense]|nr:hypothetical protein BKA69DRAFT_1043427 [Paraphysoderma sedebokerense]